MMIRLHDEIMNIPFENDFVTTYKIGHRDARHAAAELSLKYEGFMYALIDALENRHADDLVDELKEKYGL